MGDANWRTTPQEIVLDTIYESLVGSELVPDIYGVTEDRPLALLYVEDDEGNCWQVTATRHPHHR